MEIPVTALCSNDSFIAIPLIIKEEHHGREKMCPSIMRLRSGKRKRILLRSM